MSTLRGLFSRAKWLHFHSRYVSALPKAEAPVLTGCQRGEGLWDTDRFSPINRR
jgi:hypothetical protein